MARLLDYEHLYAAFREFIAKCLLDDKSLLWPDKVVWTSENVTAVKEHLVDHPQLDNNLSFDEKLQLQMSGSSTEQWMLLCDAHYIYYLTSTTIRYSTKIEKIRQVATSGKIITPPDNDEIWTPLRQGCSATSQKYHLRYAQLWLILLFAKSVKDSADPHVIVEQPEQMKEVLDSLLNQIPARQDRAYDMRHVMLYMAFPDYYERLISTRDKDNIIEVFKKQIPEPLSADRDEALWEIRQYLGAKYDPTDRPYDYYRDLQNVWKTVGIAPESIETSPIVTTKETEVQSREVVEALALLNHTRNIILYGPPGTGKTFLAQRIVDALVQPQLNTPATDTALVQLAIEGLTFYQIIALSMFSTGANTHYSVSSILNQAMVQARIEQRPLAQAKATVWSTLQAHTGLESQTVNVTNRTEPFLFDKDGQSQWFLTNGGKEYVEQTLSDSLGMLRSKQISKSIANFSDWVTFHQSYGYEDFIEGIRPALSDDSPEGIKYHLTQGVFKRISDLAAADPNNKYVLVIDEINRGNIAKILGELITLLEDDKRKGQRNELAATLPYSGVKFSVPSNLYIIGTMNTADRSIALLDVALRRRFAFVEVMPRPDLLDSVIVNSAEGAVNLGNLLRNLNQKISKHLDRQYQIGHSYLLTVANATKQDQVYVLEYVWNNQIFPLLEEYFYSRRDQLAEVLDTFVDKVSTDKQESDEFVAISPLVGDPLIYALESLANSKL
jgi:hypothetical protein